MASDHDKIVQVLDARGAVLNSLAVFNTISALRIQRDGILAAGIGHFFPLNGAHKAAARDFDGDGDLEIAAISFFPDY